MATKLNTFESGSNGAAITTGNSASPDAWQSVTLGSGATATYSNTQAKSGTLSGKLDMDQNIAYVTWTFSAVTQLYVRLYFYLNTTEDNQFDLLRLRSSTAEVAKVSRVGQGFLRVNDAVSAGTSGSVITATGQWIRVEFKYTAGTSTGDGEIRYYSSAESTSITETILRPDRDFGANCTELRIGNDNTRTNGTWSIMYYDAVAYDTANWLGPYGGTPTAVGKDRNLKWHDRAKVGQADQMLWKDLAKVSKTRQALWNDLGNIGKSRQALWSILLSAAAVGKFLETVWGYGGNVGLSLQVLWHTSVVGRSVTVVWSTEAVERSIWVADLENGFFAVESDGVIDTVSGLTRAQADALAIAAAKRSRKGGRIPRVYYWKAPDYFEEIPVPE